MADDYSYIQGSDYIHTTKQKDKSNLFDIIGEGIKTFAAIRGGKMDMDAMQTDREQKSKLLGLKMQQDEEDRQMKREEFGMKKRESDANIASINEKTKFYGQAKPVTEEQRLNLIAKTKEIEARIAALDPNNPENKAELEILHEKKRALSAATEGKELANKADFKDGARVAKPTLASAKSTDYSKKAEDTLKMFNQGVSKNKTQEKDPSTISGVVELDDPDPKKYVKNYAGRQQALEAYEALEQIEKDGDLDATQKRQMAELADLLKMQTEEQLPNSPVINDVKEFERSKLKSQIALPPFPGQVGFEQFKKDRQPPPPSKTESFLGTSIKPTIAEKVKSLVGFESLKNPDMNRASVFASGNVGKPTTINALTGKFQDKGEVAQPTGQKATTLMNPMFGTRIEPAKDGSNMGEVLAAISKGGDYTKKEVDRLLAELVSSKNITQAVADDIFENYTRSQNIAK